MPTSINKGSGDTAVVIMLVVIGLVIMSVVLHSRQPQPAPAPKPVITHDERVIGWAVYHELNSPLSTQQRLSLPSED